MTYIIGEACIDVKDISCQSVCPVDCIHETDRMLVIDAEECIDCGACEPECPVEAILPGGRDPAGLGAVREDQLRVQQGHPRGRGARRDVRRGARPHRTEGVSDELLHGLPRRRRAGAASSWAAARSGSRRPPDSSRAAPSVTVVSPELARRLRRARRRVARARVRGGRPRGHVPRDRGDVGARGQRGRASRRRGARDALQRRRRAGALQLHPPGRAPRGPDRRRGLDRRRLARAREAAADADRRARRPGARRARRGAALAAARGQGALRDLRGAARLLRGARRRSGSRDGVARRRRPGRSRADHGARARPRARRARRSSTTCWSRRSSSPKRPRTHC